MRCASCGFENPECAKCSSDLGGTVKNSCRGCGVDNLPHAKFCAHCGTAIAVAEKPLPAKSRKRTGTTIVGKAKQRTAPSTAAKSRPAAPEAERRQLTVIDRKS